MLSEYPIPQKYIAKLVSKNPLNFRVIEVIFELVDPQEFTFIPGQFINLSVGSGVFRSYSISSSQSTKKTVSLLMEIAHEGSSVNFIKGLNVGDPVEFIGPSGRFCLPDTLEKKIVFIVTGTGIAPILSMLDYLIERRCDSEIILYFGVRNTEETFKIDYLENCVKQLPHFDYKLCYSNPLTAEEQKNLKVVSGRVTDIINTENPLNCLYLLCGHPYMIADMIKILAEKGVPEDKILHERFTVAQKKD